MTGAAARHWNSGDAVVIGSAPLPFVADFRFGIQRTPSILGLPEQRMFHGTPFFIPNDVP